MKNKLFKALSSVIVLAVVVSGIFIYQNSEYNANPDNNAKVIGTTTLRENFSSIPIESIDDLVSYSDLVVIGEVISDGVVTKAEWPKVEGDITGETELSKRPPATVTHTNVKITKTLYGKPESDYITLLQLGDASWGETKVKKNAKMLFVLKKAEKENLYSSVSWEDGLFNISQDDKLSSMTDIPGLSKYDGTNVELLERDIAKAFKKLNK